MTTIDDLIRDQESRFLERTPRSQSMWREASAVMPGGVTSSWASTRPIPVWIDRGHGSHVWDVDGNEYVDYHAGYGVNVVGHGNPHVVEAVQRRVTRGTHFAQPTPDSIEVARMLGERFGLPQWRFTNSGTEATMDAVHLARAITGRDLIVKVEGSYHGHHDALNVSLWRSLERLGPAESPHQQSGAGIPQVMAELVRIVPFNDVAAAERVFAAEGDRIAAMILEPMMMNAGIIPPAARLPRGVAHDHAAARRVADLRRGEDRAGRRSRWRDRAVRRHARRRSAWRRRSAAACPAARSAAATT